eukprot:s3566_g1.t1
MNAFFRIFLDEGATSSPSNTRDGTDVLLTEAALGALDAFAALLLKSDLGLPQRRSILQIAWDTAREGDALLGHEDCMALHKGDGAFNHRLSGI